MQHVQPSHPSAQSSTRGVPQAGGSLSMADDNMASSSHALVDPMHHKAILETNQALKAELQRLSLIEFKYKALENQLKSVSIVADAGDTTTTTTTTTTTDIELKLNKLLEYKAKVESMEAEIRALQAQRHTLEATFVSSERESRDLIQTLRDENEFLKEKINSMDALLRDNEANYKSLKCKERTLEERIAALEKQLDSTSVSQQQQQSQVTDREMARIGELEEANAAMRRDMDESERAHRAEKAKLAEKMDMLLGKKTSRIRALEDESKRYEEALEAKMREEAAMRDELEAARRKVRAQTDEELGRMRDENAALQGELEALRGDYERRLAACVAEKGELSKQNEQLENCRASIKRMESTMTAECMEKLKNRIGELESNVICYQSSLETHESELSDARHAHERAEQQMRAQLVALGAENTDLFAQLKMMSEQVAAKDDELVRLDKALADMRGERERMRGEQQRVRADLEAEVARAQAAVQRSAEAHVGDMEQSRRAHREQLAALSKQCDARIDEMQARLNSQALHVEHLLANGELLKLEAGEAAAYKAKYEAGVRELDELRRREINERHALDAQRSSQQALDAELKQLRAQLANLVCPLFCFACFGLEK